MLFLSIKGHIAWPCEQELSAKLTIFLLKIRCLVLAGSVALARVAISFGGELNVMTQGTRKEIIAEIMEWSAT